jgi:hypothetical protein
MNDDVCYLKFSKAHLFRTDLTENLIFHFGMFANAQDDYIIFFKDRRNGDTITINGKEVTSPKDTLLVMEWPDKKKRLKGAIISQLNIGRMLYEIIKFDHKARNYFQFRYSKNGGNIVPMAQWSENL